MARSSYQEMYLVTKNVYRKVLDCLDETERHVAEALNREEVEEEQALRPSEALLGDISRSDVTGIQGRTRFIRDEPIMSTEQEQQTGSESSFPRLDYGGEVSTMSEPSIVPPVPRLTEETGERMMYRPGATTSGLQAEVIRPQTKVPVVPPVTRRRGLRIQQVDTPQTGIHSVDTVLVPPPPPPLPGRDRFPSLSDISELDRPESEQGHAATAPRGPTLKFVPEGVDPTYNYQEIKYGHESFPEIGPAVVYPGKKPNKLVITAQEARKWRNRERNLAAQRRDAALEQGTSGQQQICPPGVARTICANPTLPPSKQQLKCYVCGKILTGQYSLTRHINTFHLGKSSRDLTYTRYGDETDPEDIPLAQLRRARRSRSVPPLVPSANDNPLEFSSWSSEGRSSRFQLPAREEFELHSEPSVRSRSTMSSMGQRLAQREAYRQLDAQREMPSPEQLEAERQAHLQLNAQRERQSQQLQSERQDYPDPEDIPLAQVSRMRGRKRQKSKSLSIDPTDVPLTHKRNPKETKVPTRARDTSKKSRKFDQWD